MRLTRPLIAWSFYDWASSPVPTLHTTFIFSVFFATAVMPEGGTVAWAWMTSASALLIALLAPLLGRLADGRGAAKRYLALATLIGAVTTACLAVTVAYRSTCSAFTAAGAATGPGLSRQLPAVV